MRWPLWPLSPHRQQLNISQARMHARGRLRTGFSQASGRHGDQEAFESELMEHVCYFSHRSERPDLPTVDKHITLAWPHQL